MSLTPKLSSTEQQKAMLKVSAPSNRTPKSVVLLTAFFKYGKCYSTEDSEVNSSAHTGLNSSLIFTNDGRIPNHDGIPSFLIPICAAAWSKRLPCLAATLNSLLRERSNGITPASSFLVTHAVKRSRQSPGPLNASLTENWKIFTNEIDMHITIFILSSITVDGASHQHQPQIWHGI